MSTLLEEHYVETKASAKLYAEAEADLLKLKVAKRTTRYARKLIVLTVTFLLGTVSFGILLISLGFAFSEYFQNTSLGFVCSGLVGFLFTVIAGVLTRKLVERPIIQKVLKELSNV